MPRPHRDVREIAIEAALYHKQRVPTEEVRVRDLRDGTVVTIGWTDGKRSCRSSHCGAERASRRAMS